MLLIRGELLLLLITKVYYIIDKKIYYCWY